MRGWLISGALRGYKFNNREWRVTRSALRDYIARQAATSDLLRETTSRGTSRPGGGCVGAETMDGTDEDAQDGAGDVRVVVQVDRRSRSRGSPSKCDRVAQPLDWGSSSDHAASARP